MYCYSNCLFSDSNCVNLTGTVCKVTVTVTDSLCHIVTDWYGCACDFSYVKFRLLVNDNSIITVVQKMNPEDFERE